MSGEAVRTVTRCRVCGSAEEWQRVISFGEVPLANSFQPTDEPHEEEIYPLEVVSCRACRLLSLTVVVDPELLYRTYPYVTSDSETMTRHMREVVRLCHERSPLAEGDLVVELGSNTGQQLMAFRDAGARVLGVDPALNLAQIAESRGAPTVPEFFDATTAEAIASRHGKAAAILGRHVFAHVDDLGELLAGARKLLADDGLFTIEVPYAVDLLNGLAFDTIYHEHLSYFLVSTLDTLFARHGLRTVDVARLSVHGGSILVSAGLAECRWPTHERVHELIAHERAAGYLADEAYERFAVRVRETCAELTALVRCLVSDGHRVACYGASAKGTTLLNICGLGPEELDFCTDTTPQKQGLFTPGSHLPVLSPDDVRRQPDYYLLLAWNYAEEIMRRESAFLEGGGSFIVPVPEPKVYTEPVIAR